MLEYTYDEVTGRLWSDHFEGFCTGLRDLCGLDVDVDRSSVSMATYYQEYRISDVKHGVERDDMPEFLADHGIDNDLTRSRANPANWVLYLTEKEGKAEKFEELFTKDVVSVSCDEDLVTTEVIADFEEDTYNTNTTTNTTTATVEGGDSIEESASENTEEEKEEDEGSEVESESEATSEPLVSTEVIIPDSVKAPEPDFDYVKSLKEKENGEDLLKEYGTQFGIEVTGKNFKGCYISFCNKWKRIQKAKA